MKSKATGVSSTLILVLCVASFCIGMIFTNRMWTTPEPKEHLAPIKTKEEHLEEEKQIRLSIKDCENLMADGEKDVIGEISKTHDSIQALDKTISGLEAELAEARSNQNNNMNGLTLMESSRSDVVEPRQKAFVVIGINTAFSSHKRRDSIRETWMPQGEKRKHLEQEKGIIVRFVIGHSSTTGGNVLDRAIDAEDAQHSDFLKLDHIEGYHELSAKTKTYFATASAKWDADFFVKVDDDVHVNLGMLSSILAEHRSKPRVYIGCMKSGPVLSQKGVKYQEPEHWKFGERGNKYFRHATGQLYAISKDLATYIALNLPILHKFANEDVSLGAWLIGLDVVHVDDRRLCCGTPPDCEWKAKAGNVCAASFDWTCSGICKSVDRMKDIQKRCGEDEQAVWTAFSSV
ncbi:hypothetical protein GOP47_0010171 [Adiantum capillus-veneris]|uniref:Hexosyltransferase n=1 Tax=Adiantum capillus-veneris TaxID=13818 RepID=A0A9D4UUV2_ADICA|nr:hypothetical protein GOP47_0010171 [Adiantum capillus-veneris]